MSIPFEPDPKLRDYSLPLSLEQQDKHGFVPDPMLIGATLTHTGNEKQYIVLHFTWLGATDEWGYIAREIGTFGASITRPLSHLCGRRSSDVERYQEWDEYAQFWVED